jgi:mannitol 2-dehydrogenase
MCEGTREDGTIIEANDPDWSYLHEHAKAARHNPKKWLEMEHIYGNLINEDSFASAFERWLKSIYENGIEQTIRLYLDE